MTGTPNSGSVYPWREDASVTLLVDPGHFVPEMLAAIAAARHYILLEMYCVESGALTSHILDALLDAAGRGVAVKIIFDAFGSRHLKEADRKRLQHPSIEIAFYHPLKFWELLQIFIRDHRKLLLVDGQVGFTGGVDLPMGLSLTMRHPNPGMTRWFDLKDTWSGTGSHYLPDSGSTSPASA